VRTIVKIVKTLIVAVSIDFVTALVETKSKRFAYIFTLNFPRILAKLTVCLVNQVKIAFIG
jgi:hypothetical protein